MSTRSVTYHFGPKTMARVTKLAKRRNKCVRDLLGEALLAGLDELERYHAAKDKIVPLSSLGVEVSNEA